MTFPHINIFLNYLLIFMRTKDTRNFLNVFMHGSLIDWKVLGIEPKALLLPLKSSTTIAVTPGKSLRRYKQPSWESFACSVKHSYMGWFVFFRMLQVRFFHTQQTKDLFMLLMFSDFEMQKSCFGFHYLWDWLLWDICICKIL